MKTGVDPSYNQPVLVPLTIDQCIRLVTPHGLAILEHLAAIAIQQKADARRTRRKWKGGWTHVRPTRHVKLATIRALIRLGLVQSCCSSHNGSDTVRITRKGVELLEQVNGEEILA